MQYRENSTFNHLGPCLIFLPVFKLSNLDTFSSIDNIACNTNISMNVNELALKFSSMPIFLQSTFHPKCLGKDI